VELGMYFLFLEHVSTSNFKKYLGAKKRGRGGVRQVIDIGHILLVVQCNVGWFFVFSNNHRIWVLEDFMTLDLVFFLKNLEKIYFQHSHAMFQKIAKDNFTWVLKCKFSNILY
jgi:hypothetical protein